MKTEKIVCPFEGQCLEAENCSPDKLREYTLDICRAPEDCMLRKEAERTDDFLIDSITGAVHDGDVLPGPAPSSRHTRKRVRPS